MIRNTCFSLDYTLHILHFINVTHVKLVHEIPVDLPPLTGRGRIHVLGTITRNEIDLLCVTFHSGLDWSCRDKHIDMVIVGKDLANGDIYFGGISRGRHGRVGVVFRLSVVNSVVRTGFSCCFLVVIGWVGGGGGNKLKNRKVTRYRLQDFQIYERISWLSLWLAVPTRKDPNEKRSKWEKIQTRKDPNEKRSKREKIQTRKDPTKRRCSLGCSSSKQNVTKQSSKQSTFHRWQDVPTTLACLLQKRRRIAFLRDAPQTEQWSRSLSELVLSYWEILRKMTEASSQQWRSSNLRAESERHAESDDNIAVLGGNENAVTK